MDESLISGGVNLMLLGMGTVFIFLTVLVFVTTAMSSFVQKYFPEPLPQAETKRQDVSSAGSQNTLLAVITAAIHQHRSGKR